MALNVKQFLAEYEPFVTETAVWDDLPLSINYYLATVQPPRPYITSVRAVVFHQEAVLVVQDKKKEYFIVTGGRCEKNESLAETLHREVLEETGWTIANPTYFGFAHFHHLAPRPAAYAYPHPDFFQLFYVATADQYFSDRPITDDYVVAATLMPVQMARELDGMSQSQKLLLDAAWQVFRQRPNKTSRYLS
jgi:ADP-ribose pyrophosphatase YjhB (NUDIX family)